MKIKRKLFTKVRALTHSIRYRKSRSIHFIDRNNNNAESRLNTSIFEEIDEEA